MSSDKPIRQTVILSRGLVRKLNERRTITQGSAHGAIAEFLRRAVELAEAEIDGISEKNGQSEQHGLLKLGELGDMLSAVLQSRDEACIELATEGVHAAYHWMLYRRAHNEQLARAGESGQPEDAGRPQLPPIP